MNKLISIIIPAYKVEKYISKCIESIQSSSYKNWELIIINDCSPDNTENIILNYASFDSRITYLRNDFNLKASESRNKGLLQAKGDYILFVDADDYISPKWIENLLIAAEKEEADVVIGKSIEFNDSESKDYKITDLDSSKVISYKNMRMNRNSVLWNKLYKKSLISKHRFNKDVKTGQDLLFNYLVLAKANKIYYTDKGYYYYRLDNQNSITRTKSKKDIIESYIKTLKVMGTYNKNIKEINSITMYKIAEAILFNWYQMKSIEKTDLELPIKEIRKISKFLPEKIWVKVMSKKVRRKL